MFTIKFYTDSGRQLILAADSFTVLRSPHPDDPNVRVGLPSEMDGMFAEITLHRKDGDDIRYDIGLPNVRAEVLPNVRAEVWPPVFQRAIIENVAGKTTEIISVPMNFGNYLVGQKMAA